MTHYNHVLVGSSAYSFAIPADVLDEDLLDIISPVGSKFDFINKMIHGHVINLCRILQ